MCGVFQFLAWIDAGHPDNMGTLTKSLDARHPDNRWTLTKSHGARHPDNMGT